MDFEHFEPISKIPCYPSFFRCQESDFSKMHRIDWGLNPNVYTYTPPTHHHHTHTFIRSWAYSLIPPQENSGWGNFLVQSSASLEKVSDEGKVKHFFLLLLICFVLFFAPPVSYNLPSRFWNSYFHPLLIAEQVFLWGKSTKTSYLVTFLM